MALFRRPEPNHKCDRYIRHRPRLYHPTRYQSRLHLMATATDNQVVRSVGTTRTRVLEWNLIIELLLIVRAIQAARLFPRRDPPTTRHGGSAAACVDIASLPAQNEASETRQSQGKIKPGARYDDLSEDELHGPSKYPVIRSNFARTRRNNRAASE